MKLTAFPPILSKNAHTLILGSMPGVKSLQLNQYYGHPQNQFWKFMGDIYDAGPDLPYEQRVKVLQDKGVAVWDVLKACVRPGSMDSDITDAEVNDFHAFFKENPTIALVVFDSKTAEKLYRAHVDLTLPMKYAVVPSPSPAYAKMKYPDKLAAWRSVLLPAGEESK